MQQSWQGTKRSEPLGSWRECLCPDTRVYSGSQRNWSRGAWESACSWGEMFNLSKENFCRNFFTSLSTSLPFCPSFWDGTFRKTYIYIKRNTKIFIFFSREYTSGTLITTALLYSVTFLWDSVFSPDFVTRCRIFLINFLLNLWLFRTIPRERIFFPFFLQLTRALGLFFTLSLNAVHLAHVCCN